MEEDIIKVNSSFDEDFRDLISLEDIKYLYHVTNANGDLICEEGLFLQENRLDSTTIEIPKEFKKNPTEYALGERGNEYRENPNIVILGIPYEEIEYAIQKNFNNPKDWTKEELPNYVIPSKYIVGFINTNNLEIIKNENYEFIDEYYI